MTEPPEIIKNIFSIMMCIHTYKTGKTPNKKERLKYIKGLSGFPREIREHFLMEQRCGLERLILDEIDTGMDNIEASEGEDREKEELSLQSHRLMLEKLRKEIKETPLAIYN